MQPGNSAHDVDEVVEAGEPVARARERARARVHDDRELFCLAVRVDGVKLGGIHREARVHGMQFERDRAEVTLAAQFGEEGVVDVRVDVGDQPEPVRVVLGEGDGVLDGLHSR